MHFCAIFKEIYEKYLKKFPNNCVFRQKRENSTQCFLIFLKNSLVPSYPKFDRRSSIQVSRKLDARSKCWRLSEYLAKNNCNYLNIWKWTGKISCRSSNFREHFQKNGDIKDENVSIFMILFSPLALIFSSTLN